MSHVFTLITQVQFAAMKHYEEKYEDYEEKYEDFLVDAAILVLTQSCTISIARVPALTRSYTIFIARVTQVQYAAMSHYEEKYEDFLVDAAILRRRFQPDGEARALFNDAQFWIIT